MVEMLFKVLLCLFPLCSVECLSLEKTNELSKLPNRRSFVGKMISSLVALQLSTVKPSVAMTLDKKTGIALPDPGEIEGAIPEDWTKVDNPFEETDSSSKSMFSRLDSTPDSIFYTDPRFVEHVDDNAVQLMTEYISSAVASGGDSVLDLCSSWTSHFDRTKSRRPTRFSGLGMNEKELQANNVLTDWVVQDLNAKPKLPYENDTFDTILCQLSIDYLTSPLEVLKEAGRVLKPGGKIHILFSNRLFLSKAVGLWTGADDIDHAFYVGSYLHFSGGSFGSIMAKDLSTRKGRGNQIVGDPLYVVTAAKK